VNVAVWSHRVTYAEVDAQALVYHSRYLEWMDAAAYEFFRAGGWTPHDLALIGFDFVVAHADVTYHGAARLDDLVQISVAVEQIGRTSFRLAYAVKREEEILVTAFIDYVNVVHGLPSPLPRDVRIHLIGSAGASPSSSCTGEDS
jgi:acyl-CoA thioester hydrolase